MRQELDSRPTVAVFLGLAVGVCAFLNPLLGLLALPLLLLFRRWGVRLACLVAAMVGFALYPRVDTELVTEEGFIEGEVDVLTMPVTTGSKLRAIVEHENARYVLYMDSESDAVLGDHLRVRAEVSPFNEAMAPMRSTVGVMRAISKPVVLDKGSPVWRAGLWVRRSFLTMTSRFAHEKSGPLLDGMCFSMTSEIPTDFRQAMSKTGTTHMVSTSGLHVVLAAFALTFVVGAIPMPRWSQMLVLGFLLGLYAAAAGFQPPVVRAVLMMVVFSFAYLLRRGSDGLSALCFAGALSLLWAPELVQDIGFQLSMVAVGSLVLFSALPEGEQPDLREWALRYAEASIVVTVATAPLLAYHFGTVPLMSLPANMLIVPVLGIVIAGALASWVFWLAVPAIGVGMLKVCVEPMTGWTALVIEKLGSLPFSSIAVPEFSGWWLLPLYVCLAALWRPRVRSG